MAILYLTEQGSKVTKTGDRIVVLSSEKKELLEIECRHLESILLFGNIQVTTQALAELLDHEIELALLTQSGRLRGQLTPPRPRNIALRLRQYHINADPAHPLALALARQFVLGKLDGACRLLQAQLKNYPSDPLRQAVAGLEAARVSAAQADRLPSLLGIEGSAARAYFAALGACCRGGRPMQGRSSRPPLDPMNALLSFGYTLLGQEIASLLDAIGLDPYIGFYHVEAHGRPALALDLLEEFRHACVDRLALRLNNLRILTLADFEGAAPPQAPPAEPLAPPALLPPHAPAPTADSEAASLAPQEADSPAPSSPQPPPAGQAAIPEAPEPAIAGTWRLRPPALRKFLAQWQKWLETPVRIDGEGPARTWRAHLRGQCERLARAIRTDGAEPYRHLGFAPPEDPPS